MRSLRTAHNYAANFVGRGEETSYIDLLRLGRDSLMVGAGLAVAGGVAVEAFTDGPRAHAWTILLGSLAATGAMGAWATNRDIGRLENEEIRFAALDPPI